MDVKECKDCKYFLQHYILSERGLTRVFCGHCTFSGAKSKRSYAKCCEHYVEGVPDTERFASKEYLTKALLEYVLSMELLPPIEQYKSTAV